MQLHTALLVFPRRVCDACPPGLADAPEVPPEDDAPADGAAEEAMRRHIALSIHKESESVRKRSQRWLRFKVTQLALCTDSWSCCRADHTLANVMRDVAWKQ